ncbi:WGxxGxxG-CTERM domain-containing protein [Aurantimonas sp. HBX-1]|nr:WGxxGxxG-CTERM domain-containing protein [Aurantimonas sp. HBX-1]
MTNVDQDDDDGFDLGWLGLIGLLGLAGLAGRKRTTHVDTVNRPIDPANRPRV